MNNINWKRIFAAFGFLFVMAFVFLCFTQPVMATNTPDISIDFNATQGGRSMGELDILILFVVLAVLPSMILLMSSFTRIIIVFSFLRNAIGTQQSPPNQIFVGLAIFLSLFIMAPVISEINTVAYQPYMAEEVTQQEAIKLAEVPLKTFMLKQVDKDSLDLFLSISKQTLPTIDGSVTQESLTHLGMEVIIPAYVTSELKVAFTIGFLLYIPFLVIDLIVASTLMSMGMVMLPPTTIALPFKIMVFVLADGWSLVMRMLVNGFK